MRPQWCREHIDETAENCGLAETTVQEVKQAANFAKAVPEMSGCATKPILALIRVQDENVRNRAISLARNALKRETPTGGQVQRKLTEPEIRRIIRKAREDLGLPANGNGKPAQATAIPPAVPEAPIAQELKVRYNGQDENTPQSLGFTTADRLDAAKPLIERPPIRIVKTPLTDQELADTANMLIERSGFFTQKEIEQIDDLVRVGYEGVKNRADLINKAVSWFLSQTEGE